MVSAEDNTSTIALNWIEAIDSLNIFIEGLHIRQFLKIEGYTRCNM